MSDLTIKKDAAETAAGKLEWENSDNNAFYEAVKAEGLQELAEKGGLASGCDMQILTPYWSQAESILEVGAGYGRVIDYLIKHQCKGKITAIERCHALFEHLRKNFSHNKNVYLLHKDICFLDDANDRFDLIVCMWSGIADFPANTQLFFIKKLAKLLQKKGALVIDTMPANKIPLGAKKYNQQTYLLEINDSSVHMYLPDIYEIKHYAKETGFSKITSINYKTTVGRERCLYILS